MGQVEEIEAELQALGPKSNIVNMQSMKSYAEWDHKRVDLKIDQLKAKMDQEHEALRKTLQTACSQLINTYNLANKNHHELQVRQREYETRNEAMHTEIRQQNETMHNATRQQLQQLIQGRQLEADRKLDAIDAKIALRLTAIGNKMDQRIGEVGEQIEAMCQEASRLQLEKTHVRHREDPSQEADLMKPPGHFRQVRRPPSHLEECIRIREAPGSPTMRELLDQRDQHGLGEAIARRRTTRT